MVSNLLTVDGWAVVFTRSLDFGQNWETPMILGWYCQGWNAEDARPDIGFGSGYLYIAYSSPIWPCPDESREIYVKRSTVFGGSWDGTGADGRWVAPGIYFIRLEGDGGGSMRTVAVLR